MKLLGVVKFEDYLRLLDSGIEDKPVLADLIFELTISESFFFRNSGQFEYIYHKFLPELFATRGHRHPVRIWSAGCARGEEAYSIAMVARRFQVDHPECSFHIYAGDINSKNLLRAKEARYGARAFRNRVERFEALFDMPLGKNDENGNFVLREDIKNMVQFRRLNLKQLHGLKCLAGSDIIFCRNVLIYFSEDFRRILVDEFARYLSPGGILCLGESECLPRDAKEFALVSYKNSYCYQKPSGIQKHE
jgi:chemotaxis protein methyltransferase CheR